MTVHGRNTSLTPVYVYKQGCKGMHGVKITIIYEILLEKLDNVD